MVRHMEGGTVNDSRRSACTHTCNKSVQPFKNCKFLPVVQSCVINVTAAETVKKVTEKEKNSDKE